MEFTSVWMILLNVDLKTIETFEGIYFWGDEIFVFVSSI